MKKWLIAGATTLSMVGCTPEPTMGMDDVQYKRLLTTRNQLVQTIDEKANSLEQHNFANSQEVTKGVACLRGFNSDLSKLKLSTKSDFTLVQSNLTTQANQAVVDCQYQSLYEKVLGGEQKHIENYKQTKFKITLLEDYFNIVWVDGATKYTQPKGTFAGTKEKIQKIKINLESLKNYSISNSQLLKGLQNQVLEIEQIQKDHEIYRKSVLLGLKKEDTKLTQIPDAPNSKGLSIAVSLKSQTMYVFKDGALLASTPVTTGKSATPTPKGDFSVLSSNVDGIGLKKEKSLSFRIDEDGYKRYPSDVASVNKKYGWDPEIGSKYFFRVTGNGIGIHDANDKAKKDVNKEPDLDNKYGWRYTYGSTAYTTQGSHGCINTPIKFIETVFLDSGLMSQYYNQKDFQIKVKIY